MGTGGRCRATALHSRRVGGARARPGAGAAPVRRAGLPGQVLLWLVILVPVAFGSVGLAVDGGLLFLARREAQHVADGAARAGAAEIDQAVYIESDGERVVIDAGAARAAIGAYLDATGWPEASAEIGATAVRVEARGRVRLAFLGMFGVPDPEVAAVGEAAPFYGLGSGERP